MNVIRQIQKVKSGTVTIALPPEYNTKQVEIIVFPIDEVNDGSQNLQNLLLAAPTLTGDEIQEFNKVREWMSQRIEELTFLSAVPQIESGYGKRE